MDLLTPFFDLRLRCVEREMEYLVWCRFRVLRKRERVFQWRRWGFIRCDVLRRLRYDRSVSSVSNSPTTGHSRR